MLRARATRFAARGLRRGRLLSTALPTPSPSTGLRAAAGAAIAVGVSAASLYSWRRGWSLSPPPEAADDPSSSSADAATPATLHECYELGDELGRGHFAVVHRGVHRATGAAVAIKAIEKTRSDSDAIRREIEILRRVGSHRNIVELKDVFETDTNWYLVMELVTGGELFERLVRHGPYSEAEASALTKQMGAAIAYLHSQGVVHRDLKPENLLLTRDAGANADNTTADDTVKICDFGLSVALGRNGTLSEKQGTWAYWAPEMFAPVGTYGKQVDMWSLGVILYIILSGRHPFDSPGRSDAQMRNCIQDAHVSFSHDAWAGVSSDAKELIQGLLRANPKQRLTAEELLVHPWIVGAQFGSVNTLPMPRSDERMGKFQRTTMKKFRRSLVGSIHRQATVRKRQSEKSDGVQVVGGGTAAAERRKEEALLLEDAFREFDPEGKGYVEEAQMAGVVARLGQSATPEEVRAMVTTIGGSGGKVHYSDYLDLTTKVFGQQARKEFKAGTVIFSEGDPSDYFYLLTSGKVRRTSRRPRPGADGYAATDSLETKVQSWMPTEEYLHAGDYFGTSAILGSGQRTRHSTLTAVTDVSVVALSKDDFEIDGTDGERRLSSGYAAPGAGSGSGARASSGSRDGGGSGGSGDEKFPERRASQSGRARERSLRFINMMASTTPLSYAAGERLFAEGDAGDTMFIIKRGHAQVSFTHPDGRVEVISQRAAGECCGETSCLLRKPRNVTVTCVSGAGCEALRVSRADFLALMRGSWDVAHDLVAVSERHLKEKERRVKFIRTQSEAAADDDVL